jgi:large subunit ribosomal protein L9
MQVVLLERVEKLGQIGDVVKVKDGFARNYLLPKKKALRATKANLSYFETQRSQLEARNLEQRKEAEQVGAKLKGKSFVLLRQAGDRGQLYGSVSPRDIADTITAGGFSIVRTQVPIDRAIKTIGMHEISVVLHPEVRVPVSSNWIIRASLASAFSAKRNREMPSALLSTNSPRLSALRV